VRKWLGKELVVPKKRFSAEQIVTLLRQIEVSMAQGKSAPEACRDAGISEYEVRLPRLLLQAKSGNKP
jgi:hypothetical protein